MNSEGGHGYLKELGWHSLGEAWLCFIMIVHLSVMHISSVSNTRGRTWIVQLLGKGEVLWLIKTGNT